MKNSANSFSFTRAEDSTGFLLWQLTSFWQREIKKTLEPLDLTHTQFVLLASILWFTLQKKNVTQIILSSHTKIDTMTISTVLRILQAKDLINRQEHSTDSRAKTVALTDKGTKIVKKAIKKVELFDSYFFSKLKSKLTTFNENILTLLIE
ncbi:MAG: MarR family transcriptional regulator [Ferruginibacter sp.]